MQKLQSSYFCLLLTDQTLVVPTKLLSLFSDDPINLKTRTKATTIPNQSPQSKMLGELLLFSLPLCVSVFCFFLQENKGKLIGARLLANLTLGMTAMFISCLT